MSAIRGSTAGTRLCDDCEGLRFDGEACGGFMGTSEKGTPALRFSERHGSFMNQHRTDSTPGLPKLAASAEAGCAFCDFLRAAVLRAKIKGLKRKGEISMDLYYAWAIRSVDPAEEEGLRALVVKLRVRHARGEEPADLCFYVYSRDEATAEWLGLQRPPHKEALGPENVAFLKGALESCTSTCHPPRHTSFLPTRLLDVGTDDAGSQLEPRLIITAESSIAEPIRYTALSYCWGDADDATAQTKTEPSNLHERLHAVPISDMSAVMRDAVAVCRALSVRYLWIDALCIIQDAADSSDWERESEHVGKVFQNAYFTICAVASASCHQSFLDRRHDTFDFEFQSSLYPPARGTYTLVYSGWEKLRRDFDPIFTDVENSLWHTRGWVFQEEQLSARKVLFGPHMVYFDCGARLNVAENGVLSPWKPDVDWSSAALAETECYLGFESCLRGYAGRSLSYQSDWLPALSGIAKHVFDLTGGQYLAGLWKEHLYHSLLWNGRIPQGRDRARLLAALRASTGSGAPSWSWVSRLPGHVWYGLPGFDTLEAERHFRPEYGDIAGWTVLKGAQLNPFGEVESGTIRVRGKVVRPERLVPTRTGLPFYCTIWKVYQNGVIAAYCTLDWICSLTEEEPVGELAMLLLSSSCCTSATMPAYVDKPKEDEDSEDEDSEDEDSEHRHSEEEDSDDGERGDEGDDGDIEEHNENGDEDGNEDGRERDLSIDSSSEAETDSTEGSRCFLPADASECVLCNDTEHNRRAWGILIHPAEKAGEYYRMGVFLSPGEVGGTELFKDVEDQSIDLI